MRLTVPQKRCFICMSLWLFNACGVIEDADPKYGLPMIELTYQGTSNERPLEEIYLHENFDDYLSTKNLVSSPLKKGQTMSYDDFDAGNYYLSVIRKKLSLPVSDMIVLTTAEPLSLKSGRYKIWVFDESFRIFNPTSNL